MIRVADYIIERLVSENINEIFMVTGRGALFLTDAVAKHSRINSIAMHHEQAAGYAAVAYAQYKESLGACMVSTGCAATNAITPVLSAWQDGIPCIFISGQNSLQETSRHTGIPLRTYGQQEADIISLVTPITKYAVMLTDPNDIVFEIEKAIFLAKSGRKGPVWIDVPLDIQNMRIDPDQLKRFQPHDINSYQPTVDDVEYITKSLELSKRPVVLIGSGVRSSNALAQLKAFIEINEIPLTYATSAVDSYGLENALSIGSVGTMGCSRAGNFAVQNSDLLLVLGHRLTSMTTGNDCTKFARDAKVIVVDIDAIEHTKKNVNIDKVIISDIALLLNQLLKSKINQQYTPWVQKCIHWKHLFPKCEPKYKESERVDLYHLSESLSETLPHNAVCITDSGFIELILPSNITFKTEQRCLHPVSQGAMGYALPAIVGAYYASQKPIIAIIGDGSVMMNLQELETIRHHKIPVKLLIVNNNAYAIIRKRQNVLFRKRTIGTDRSNGVSCPDFSKIANCFDMQHIKIETSQNLSTKVAQVFNTDGPVLCEIMGLENQEYISTAHTKNINKRIVQRPIEDQAPFMERALFLKEMIIDPIDQ